MPEAILDRVETRPCGYCHQNACGRTREFYRMRDGAKGVLYEEARDRKKRCNGRGRPRKVDAIRYEVLM